jgi:hypothetical protein
MTTALQNKNDFVIDLKHYLKSQYGTEHCYTNGEGEFEGKKTAEGAYVSVRRDPSKPKDISGFCFRKDLCEHPPGTANGILKEIHSFASQKPDCKSTLDKDTLTIRFGKKEYLVTSFIDGGYAGEIDIYFMEAPRLSAS